MGNTTMERQIIKNEQGLVTYSNINGHEEFYTYDEYNRLSYYSNSLGVEIEYEYLELMRRELISTNTCDESIRIYDRFNRLIRSGNSTYMERFVYGSDTFLDKIFVRTNGKETCVYDRYLNKEVL